MLPIQTKRRRKGEVGLGMSDLRFDFRKNGLELFQIFNPIKGGIVQFVIIGASSGAAEQDADVRRKGFSQFFEIGEESFFVFGMGETDAYSPSFADFGAVDNFF